MKSLPKSGGWLNTVKVLLGFLELALAFKFLSIIHQVYHWRILDREIYLVIWIVIFSLMSFYILGKVRTDYDSPVEKVGIRRILIAILLFAFTVYIISRMFGTPLKGVSGYFLPETTQGFRIGGDAINAKNQ